MVTVTVRGVRVTVMVTVTGMVMVTVTVRVRVTVTVRVIDTKPSVCGETSARNCPVHNEGGE